MKARNKKKRKEKKKKNRAENLITLVIHLVLNLALKLLIDTQSTVLCKISEDVDTFCKMKKKDPYLFTMHNLFRQVFLLFTFPASEFVCKFLL